MSTKLRVQFPAGIEWVGEEDGPDMVVTDSVENGQSYRELTGQAPPIDRVPLAEIAAAGGAVDRVVDGPVGEVRSRL